MSEQRIFATEGYDILKRKTGTHSKNTRRIYVPKDWLEVVIIRLNRIEDNGGVKNEG